LKRAFVKLLCGRGSLPRGKNEAVYYEMWLLDSESEKTTRYSGMGSVEQEGDRKL
jgi:hypothetical protein